MRHTGETIGQPERQGLVQKPIVDQNERIEKMKDSGDLGGESIE